MARKKLGQLAGARRQAPPPKPRKAAGSGTPPKARKARFTWSAGDVEVGDSDAAPAGR